MALANFDFEALRKKVITAQAADDSLLKTFRTYARRLSADIKPLRPYSVNAVSFVSADGGDNRLVFNPSIIELIRVVDSRGNQYVLDVVASTSKLSELEQRATAGVPDGITPLQRLCSDLGLKLGELSFLIRGIEKPGKSTGAMRCYRDIIEWAVLYDLVANPAIQWGGDTIIVRDGLLRTKSFKLDVFPKMDEKLRAGVAAHATKNVTLSIVGVAKQSAVLGRLSVSLELEAVFHRPYPCFVPVPDDIEAECYNFDRTWLNTFETAEEGEDGGKRYHSLGKMYLVKFGDCPLDPVWPVDIAAWQVGNVEKILGQLVVDAQQGFPIPDYPACIQRAHDFAKLTGLEIQVLQDLLVQGMCTNLTPDETERLLRLKFLGQSLAALRYKEG